MSTKNPDSSSTAQQGESQSVRSPQAALQDLYQSTRTGNAVKSGPLLISSKGIGWTSWKKRWFILTTNSLIFYRNDPSVATSKSGELNLILGGIDINNSGSVEVKPDKKLLTVLFSDARDGRAFTLKAETLEDLQEWKTALETALAQAPSASTASAQHDILNSEQIEADNSSSELPKEAPKYGVIGRPVLLALEEADGSPSFLEKALAFIEDHGAKTEGILRQAADVEDVERRIREFEQGKTDFSPEEDAHVIGDCVKYVLRELPSSPVPASCCTALLKAFRTDRSKRANAMRIAILETFPEPNRKLLQRLLVMMQAVIAKKQLNRMSTSAAAACMAPLLLRPLLAGDCDVENQHIEMAGDSSLQLMQAAAAANHAQGIIIALLDEYDKIFGNANQPNSVTSELFSDEEGEGSGSGGETEYDEDEDEYEDEDNEYESDEEEAEGEEDDGSDEDEGETEEDEDSGSDNQKVKVKKNLPMESIKLTPEEEEEFKGLETEKKNLGMQIAAQGKGKESLHYILGRRKKALHERRLALEREVVKMTAQLQNERDLKAALDAGLGITQEPASTDEKEMGAEEDSQSTTSDRSIQTPDASTQETKLTNVNEAESSSHNVVEKPAAKSMLESFSSSMRFHTTHTDSARSVSMKVPNHHTTSDTGLPKPMISSASKRFNPKTELTTRLNFLKEKRSQIATELQNLDTESSTSVHSPNKAEKSKCPESGHPMNKKRGDNKSETTSSSSNHDASKKSHVMKSPSVARVEPDRGKPLEGHTTHHSEKPKPTESRSMRHFF